MKTCNHINKNSNNYNLKLCKRKTKIMNLLTNHFDDISLLNCQFTKLQRYIQKSSIFLYINSNENNLNSDTKMIIQEYEAYKDAFLNINNNNNTF